MYVKGLARRGPTFRETLLVHAVARLALHPEITNVQASWVKLGSDGTREALRAGVNDLGGTLMNESISRSAGASFGRRSRPSGWRRSSARRGGATPAHDALRRVPRAERVAASFGADRLAEPLNPPVRDAGLVAPPRLVRPGLVGAVAR